METGEAIRIEQARLLHRNVPTAVIGGFVVVCMVVAIFFRVVPTGRLLAWMAASALLSAVRLIICRKYRNTIFDYAVARQWMRHVVLGAALSGGIWGIGAIFLTPAVHFEYQLLFVWAVVMMSVAAMFSWSAHYPTFLAFLIASTVPAFFILAMQNSPLQWAMAGGTV